MNQQECTAKFCSYYKEEMFKDKELKKLTLIAMETWRWLNENIKESETEKFYKKVLENFKPTNANNFPLIANLKEIKNITEAPDIPNYKGIDFNDAQKTFSEKHGIIYEPQPGTEKISLEEIIKDDKIMTAANLLKKYGINRCGQAWIEASNRMTTEQHIEDDLKFKKGRSNPDYFHN